MSYSWSEHCTRGRVVRDRMTVMGGVLDHKGINLLVSVTLLYPGLGGVIQL